MAILAEVRDPRVRDVTVTGVEMDADMRGALVRVSVMGDEARGKLALRGLENAAGFLQARIADRIDTRYTPRLRFEIDGGVKKSIELARILHEVLPASAADGAPLPGAVPPAGSEDHAHGDVSQEDA